MKIVLIACSRQAYELMKKLERCLKEYEPGCRTACIVKCSSLGEKKKKRSLVEVTGEWFGICDAMIFISSVGIAVRAVAPYLRHKSSDPAVVVMDEKGKFCISLLSGHAGGANELTNRIAGFTGAVPVVTTATDLEGKFAVDDFARKNGLVVTDWEMAKRISAAVLEGERIGIYSELPLEGDLPGELFFVESDCYKDTSYTVCISCRVPERIQWLKSLRKRRDSLMVLQLVPKCLAAGIGCRKGTSEQAIEHAVKQCFREEGFLEEALCSVASIDLKKGEEGLLGYCRGRNLPFLTYSAEELGQAVGEFSESRFVEEVTGVSCVCERSAVLAAGSGCELLCPKRIYDGVTVALAGKRGKGIF